MATRLAILAKGRSRTRLVIICFILNRQVFFNDVNWLSDIPNPPVNRYEYTFETYPGDFWSDFRVKREHIRDWYLAFGFVDGEIKSFFLLLHVFYLPCFAYLSDEFIKTDNGSIFYGEFAFMFILKRLSSLCTLVELEVIFGREHTQLSRIQAHLIERLYGQHSWLVINNMDYCVHRFLLYNKKRR